MNLTVKRRSIATLLRSVDEKRFAIPHLQREFVWNGRAAASLLDSIYKGMPVGVILIWDTPRSQRLHLRHRYHILPAFSETNRRIWFLIDGQQRISVLHHTRVGDQLTNANGDEVDFSRVVLSLNEELDGQQVRYRQPVNDEYIPFSDILHPHWRQKLNGLPHRKLERVREARDRVLNYCTFVMFAEGTLPDVKESFLRVNTQGMKLAPSDAILAKAEALDLRDIIHDVRAQLDAGFNDIPREPILYLFSVVKGENRDPRGRAIDASIAKLNKKASKDQALRKSLVRDWGRLAACIGKAIDYLRVQFCVLNRDFLASDYMISTLAYFFYCNQRPPSTAQATEIRKWFWATSVGSRYSGRDFGRCVPADLDYFKTLAENSNRHFLYDAQIEISDVRRTQYASRAAVASAVYCLLIKRGPVYLKNKGLNDIPIDRYSTRANRKDRHHIFPKQIMVNAKVPPKRYNSVANICLLTAEENQQIGRRQPRHYLGDLNYSGGSFKRKMSRHLIPNDDNCGVWDRKREIRI